MPDNDLDLLGDLNQHLDAMRSIVDQLDKRAQARDQLRAAAGGQQQPQEQEPPVIRYQDVR